jgi:glycosyltransferase involved in cell wall biosynthesis
MWVAWEKHRRSLELCDFLSIKPHIFDNNLPRFIKYPILLTKTYSLIKRKRPSTLIVQNPSIILTLLACIIQWRFGYKLIVDTHNAGLMTDIFILKACSFLYRYFQRKADMTIVTNEALSEIVDRHNGIPYILPDRVPNLRNVRCRRLNSKYNVVFVCTFGSDEPYKEVFNAAEFLSTEITIYVTGDYNKLPGRMIKTVPHNTVFTGFIADEAYCSLLFSADLVLDLTFRENCLVCGAYEAVSVGTPMVLSDTKALRQYFYKGAVFTVNAPKEIAKSIMTALNNIERLKLEIKELKEELYHTWFARAERFKKLIEEQ